MLIEARSGSPHTERVFLTRWGVVGATVDKYTAYTIATVAMSRAWKRHKNPIQKEVSRDHVRYMFFYDGEKLPFFSVHVFRSEGVIQEYTFPRKKGAEPRLLRRGYPIVLDAENPKMIYMWNGEEWEHTPKLSNTIETFELFLNLGAVGVLWL